MEVVKKNLGFQLLEANQSVSFLPGFCSPIGILAPIPFPYTSSHFHFSKFSGVWEIFLSFCILSLQLVDMFLVVI